MKFHQVTVIPLLSAPVACFILKLKGAVPIGGRSLFQSKGITQIKYDRFDNYSFETARNN